MITRTPRNLAIAAVAIPVLGVAAVTMGQGASLNQVTGDTLACPNGSTVQAMYSLSGERFTVTGPLVSLDAQSVTVTGPSGNVTATLTVNAAVDAGLQPGMPVTVTGQLLDQATTTVASTVRDACAQIQSPTPMAAPEPAVTSTTSPSGEPEEGEEACNRGAGVSGELSFDIKHRTVSIKRATVVSSTKGMVTITMPPGNVNVMIDDGTEVKGDLSTAAEVRVKGAISGDAVRAEKVEVLCSSPGNEDEANEDNGDDHDRATPAVPAIPAVPGGHGHRATPAVPAIPAVPPHDVGHSSHHGDDHQDEHDD